MGTFLTILTFFLVIFVTAFIFAVWLVVGVVRYLWGGVGSLVRMLFSSASPRIISRPRRGQIQCVNPGCAATNPVEARFCRRCGSPTPQAEIPCAPRRPHRVRDASAA